MDETWDGVPVAREPPYACCVVVWRDGDRGREFLVLHRAHFGSGFGGDWAWTPPSGARQPGEPPDEAAARELREEAGLELPFAPVEPPPSDEVALYVAQAPRDADVRLDAEHDASRWLPLAEAAALCLPAEVAACLDAAAAALD
jgi:8-oxo-dGTP pyrophosphatase MutT (NUDIX family)